MRPRRGDPLKPTQRELQVLQYVHRRLKRRGVAPTRKEIAERFQFSRTTAEQHLQGLQGARLVRLFPCWRGIIVTQKGVQHVEG